LHFIEYNTGSRERKAMFVYCDYYYLYFSAILTLPIS
jgi:hypothetical protein